MKIRDLDHHESGNRPLTNCLRWLRSCLGCNDQWSEGQRAAASQAVAEAEALLESELAPSASREQLQALQAPITHEHSPLRKFLARKGEPVSWEELLALNLWEGAMQAKVEAMEAVLGDLSLRIAFIGWPAETFWNAGTAQKPHWVPDWRREMALLEAARHGVAFDAPDERDTRPWNQIPEEHRPGAPGEARKRLYELNLAWLRYRENEDGSPTVERLLALKDATQRVFEGRKAPAQAQGSPA